MSSIPASYFDGREARPHFVTVDIVDGTVTIVGDGIDRREPLASLQITDVLGNAPRLVRFPDGAFCEIVDGDGLRRLLAENGVSASAVSQWEGNLRWIAAGAIAFVLVLVVGYRYGIPLVAGVVANQVPAGVTERLSTEVLAILDRQLFEATEVPQERQDEIARAFSRLELPSEDTSARYRLVFRKSELLGANALALPSGTIVITDGLMTLAEDDREILGVLAHEAGHVDRRHGLRNVLQNSIVGLVVAWFIGDVSTIAAAAPTALIEANYSRELEREADTYAVEVLRANDISVRHLADILRRLDEKSGHGDAAGALRYLSSHPATSERLQRLDTR
jgi:Zn-dependent protease with chaperone function